jgi:hypothetical protein
VTCCPEAEAVPAFLLTWNPRRWPVHERDYEAWRASALRAKPVVGRWNTGQNRRRISPGDVLYWLRQGPDRRGIIGSGRAVTEVLKDVHYDDPWPPARRGSPRRARDPATRGSSRRRSHGVRCTGSPRSAAATSGPPACGRRPSVRTVVDTASACTPGGSRASGRRRCCSTWAGGQARPGRAVPAGQVDQPLPRRARRRGRRPGGGRERADRHRLPAAGAVWLRAPVPPAQQGAQVSTSRQAS